MKRTQIESRRRRGGAKGWKRQRAACKRERAEGSCLNRESDSDAESAGARPEMSGAARYRRKGNVARLPKETRQKINEMIEDGVTYREIIERLGEDGAGLSESNLSRWKEGGYQDWVAEQGFIEWLRGRQETPREMVRDFDATEVNHAALQLGTLHIYEALRELGPRSLNDKLGGDCGAFARLINALARASRETMQLQRYREACAKARSALRELDTNRELEESERRVIVQRVDELLGLGQPQEVLEKLEQGSRLGVMEERTEAERAREGEEEGKSLGERAATGRE